MANRKIVKGDIVLVSIPDGIPKNEPVWAYDGQELKVAKALYLKRLSYALLELEGAVSSMGVPYSFSAEWVKIRKEKAV